MKRILVAVVLVLAVLGVTASFQQIPVVEQVKSATFEISTNALFAASAATDWKLYWDEFARETGATLIREGYHWQIGSYIIFSVNASGGTAFFFGKRLMYETALTGSAYALTNAHTLSIGNLREELKKAKSYEKVIARIIDDTIEICPNFTELDNAPSCAFVNLKVEYFNEDLDIAVLEFKYLDKKVLNRIPTLRLGDERDYKEGTDLLIVGSAGGVNSVPVNGKLLPMRLGYIDVPGWKYTVPYDAVLMGGYSGSAVVVARTGVVLGLNRGSIMDPRGSGKSVALFIPMSLIKSYLAMNGFPIN